MEEQSKKIPKLNWLLFRNTIAILIPAMIVFGIISAVFLNYPILQRNATHVVSSFDEMNDWFRKQCYIVRYSELELKYTGYDYYENDKRIGAYYYSFVGDECFFVLVKTKKPEAVLHNKSVCGRMMSESAHLSAMLDSFIVESGLDKEAFYSVMYPIMISEIDYPLKEIVLMWGLLIVPYVISVMIMVLSLIWMIRPFTHPSTKILGEIGNRRLVYEEVSSQLQREGIVHNYHYYFTDDYLILNNLFTTNFIRIDFIRYISKHIIKNGRKQVYRVTMSNPEKMFFEKDFQLELCADEIMAELISRNPHIDDRTVHVFDLPGAELEAASETSTEPVGMTALVEQNEPVVSNANDNPESDAEDMKIYTVRRRLSQMDDDEEEMKIYEVKHRLQKAGEQEQMQNSEETENEE